MDFFTSHFKKIENFARFFLASILIFSGVNYFFNLFQMPIFSMPAQQFVYAISKTGYFMTLVKGIEILVGIMFLLNRYVFQSILIILPIIFNIFLFHLFLDFSGLLMGGLLILLISILILSKKKRFFDLFKENLE